MTVSDYSKMAEQLKPKPVKYKKFLKHNSPKERTCGKTVKKCTRCGTSRGYINKYGIGVCRRCFRDIATKIGFKKFN